MCLYPKLIENRKFRSNKKNGGVIPAIPMYKLITPDGREIEMQDERVKWVPVGCQKCIECKKQKARDWQVRLLEDVRHNKNGIFVTLTFSNESIIELTAGLHKLTGYELDNEIAKKAVRRFCERWRKKHKKSVRHWLVTELGHNGTENIHMHGIIWTDKPRQDIVEIWKYGHVWLGQWVNEQTVNYITKYIHKTDLQHKEYNSRVLTSAGIGKDYLNRINATKNKFKDGKTDERYVNRQGYKMAMPKYLRNHIYNDEEKEKLWIEKLNKETRYVMGTKIDVSKGDENYYKALEEARKLNKELGYGDNEINWERKQYENERRNINYLKRLKK